MALIEKNGLYLLFLLPSTVIPLAARAEPCRAFAQVRVACAPGEAPRLRLPQTTSGEDMRTELRCRRLTVSLPWIITYAGPD